MPHKSENLVSPVAKTYDAGMGTTLDMPEIDVHPLRLPMEEGSTTIGNVPHEGCWAASGTLEIVVDVARIAANPINRTDSDGLTWKINRTGGERAEAIPEPGDTLQSLADQTFLMIGEVREWLKYTDKTHGPQELPPNYLPGIHEDVGKYPGCASYSVPNTGYIDINIWAEGLGFLNGVTPLAYAIQSSANSVEAAWKTEGLKVVKTLPGSVTFQSVKEHMGDANLYRYMLVGAGAGASDPPNLKGRVFGLNDTSAPGTVLQLFPGKYTKFGIAEFRLYVCFGGTKFATWKTNVSTAPGTIMWAWDGLIDTFNTSKPDHTKP